MLNGTALDWTFGRSRSRTEDRCVGLAASVRSAPRRIPGTVIGYVDLHAHVLPGIDDGPSDARGALAMLRAATAAGTGTLAATPHLRSDFPGRARRRARAPLPSAPRRSPRSRGSRSGSCAAPRCRSCGRSRPATTQLALATYDQRGTDLLIETPTFNVGGLESLLYRLRSEGAARDARPSRAKRRVPA